MENIFERLFQVFSVEYMFIVIVASYFVIKAIDALNGEQAIPTWLKRVVTFAVGIITLVVFTKITEVSKETLLTSYFAAVFFYDTAIKWLIKKCDIDYKK